MTNRTHSLRISLPGILVLLAICLTGCGGSQVGLNGIDASTIGAGRSGATVLDSDYDGIPDEIELLVGTDPQSIDTDLDGLTDHYELFGVNGLPVGIVGDLANLPDQNADGVIAALDRYEAGSIVLKSVSALETDRIRVAYPDVDPQPENDLDDDWIPSDFELYGFYYELDAVSGEDWFVKWDGDLSKPYQKTDPTKWSTDGDPWSDWEEATKINLDQRIKMPGDHPCIPAYPDIYVSLKDFTVELLENVTIDSSEGGTTSDSWTQSTSRTEKSTKELGIGGSLEIQASIGTLAGFGVNLEVNGTMNLSTYESGMITENTSGLDSREWSNATTTSQNTLEVARLTMTVLVVNTGTLPASNPEILCNLKLGNAGITNFLIKYKGELKPQANQPVEIPVKADGFSVSEISPLGNPLYLSMNQLRSIQSGAPIDIEVVDFEAQTLIWEKDPVTGRRLYISYGDWSPYESAIKNVTGRIVLDFNSHPSLRLPLYHGLPAKKVPDMLVFGYDNTGIYMGSPPRIRLGDAFAWAFKARDIEETQDVTVTFTDPISKLDYTSSLYGWSFSFDQRLMDDVLAQVTPVTNLFDFPLRPGNPYEYVYVATAPPPGELEKPRIYWANMNLEQRKVRAFSLDVRGIKEMRFKPNEEYAGELMYLGVNFNDPEAAFFYTYDIPSQYNWTGLEKVIATNNADQVTELAIQIEGDILGKEVASGRLLLSYQPSSGVHQSENGINMEASGDDGAVTEPFDVILTQKRDNLGDPLEATLTPVNGGGIYDIGVAADLDQINYNYLRKRSYSFAEVPTTVPLLVPLYPTSSPQWRSVYAIRGQQGSTSLFVPELTLYNGEWYVSAITWRRFEGI